MPSLNKSQNISVEFESGSNQIPDVFFSDTTAKILQPRDVFVYATWNVAVSQFSEASLTIIWDAEDEAGNSALGRLRVLSYSHSKTGIISVLIPDKAFGNVQVIVKQRSVVSAIDNRTLGPPSPRSFTIEFDTRADYTDYGIDSTDSPATLELSTPAPGTWTGITYTQVFTWSKPVLGFVENDINVDGVEGTVTRGTLEQDTDNNKVYTMEMTLSGSGTYMITVSKDVASPLHSFVSHNSPPADVSKSWAFDAISAIFDISGVTELFSETYDINSNTWSTDENKGSFLGVSDLKVFNNKLYGVAQIQRKREGKDAVSTLNPSMGVLFSVGIGGGTLIQKDKYKVFMESARSLTVHKNELYFFQGSAYVYPNIPRGIDFSLMGVIKKIDIYDNISEVGLNWRSSFPTGVADLFDGVHGGTVSPMVSDGDALHIISHKKDVFNVNGIQWIMYGSQLNQRISVLETNGKTGFEIIESLAGLTNSILGYEKSRFIFKPRKQTQAYLNDDIDSTQDNLEYKSLNRLFASTEGTLKIDEEIMTYENITHPHITVLTRGAHDTTPVSHSVNTPIVFIDKVIDAMNLSRPINDMDIETDSTLIYNSLMTTYAENQVPRVDNLSFPTVDADSITEHGEKKFKLELQLDFHQQLWAKRMTRDFVDRYKNLGIKIRLILKREFDIELGDVIYLLEPILEDVKLLCQVMSVSQLKKSEETEVIVMSITPDTL